MTDLLQWSALQLSRRRFLKRTSAFVFGIFAGTTVRAPVALASSCPLPCVGPFGTGYCGSCLCNGASCRTGCGCECIFVTGYCPSGSACWSRSGTTCCDCHCRCDVGLHFYCFCRN